MTFKFQMSMVTPRSFSLPQLIILKFDTLDVSLPLMLMLLLILTFVSISFHFIIAKPLNKMRGRFYKHVERHQNYHEWSEECYRQHSLQYLCLLLLEKITNENIEKQRS